MEGAAYLNDLEKAPQLNLLEKMGNNEVTLFGITGTIRELAKMCPVDLNSPDISLDTINEYVVKVSNESSLEIEPELEGYFAEVLEKNGLERKFTIAEAVKPTEPEAPKVTLEQKDKITEPKIPETPQPVKIIKETPPKNIDLVAQHAHSDNAIKITLGEQARIIKQHNDKQTVESFLKPIIPVVEAAEIHASRLRDPALLGRMVYEAQKTEKTPLETDHRQIELTDIEETAPGDIQNEGLGSQEEGRRSDNTDFDDTTFATPDIEPVDATIEEFFNDNPTIEQSIELVPEIASADQQETAIVEVVDWAAELYKEPVDLFDDFTEALLLFSSLPALTEANNDVDQQLVDSQVEPSETGELLFAPPIISKVAERLTELDTHEKEQVAPIMRDIVGAIHGMQLLESSNADPESLQMVEAKLEELCISLFEAIGLEFNEEDVRQFMTAMLHPKFQPPQPAQQETIDLEHEGTREAKFHFLQLSDSLANAENKLQHMLGTLALFYAQTTENFAFAA